MQEENDQGPDLKPHEHSVTMVARDAMNNRIVVSLWTIQVVTVLFVVSMSIWVALVSGMLLDFALGVLGICCLVVLMVTLFAEFRIYVRNVLSIEIYLRLQVTKVMSWATVLFTLLEAAAGVEDAGIVIFREAVKKLILPFLASVVYSVVVYYQKGAVQAINDPESVEGLLLATERFELASPG